MSGGEFLRWPARNEAALLVRRVVKPERARLQLRQSEPNAFTDMQSTSTRECFSRPQSPGMLSPALICSSSTKRGMPSFFNRAEVREPQFLSFEL